MSQFFRSFLAACVADPWARTCLLCGGVLLAGSLTMLSLDRAPAPAPKPCAEASPAAAGCGHT